MKITIKQQQEFLKSKLQSDVNWANRALFKIYEFQTDQEKNAMNTQEYNGVGFTGFDGEILTSLINFYLANGYFTKKQQELVLRKMPKYWKQVLRISDKEKLNNMINN
jgi:hypothetical protein